MSTRTLIHLSCAVGMSVLVVVLASCALFNKLPSAGFTIGPSTTGPAPFAVTLSGAPSSDPDGEIRTYSWDFGDGAQGTGKSVAHTYTAAGTYTVILTVADNWDATDDAAKTIYVTSPEPAGPTASFSVSPASGTSPLSVTLDASASGYPGGTISAYEWTFGDGGVGFGRTTTHTFFSSGSNSYTVTLLVRTADGRTGTTSKTVSVSAAGGGGTPVAGSPSARFDILFENPAVAGDAYTNKTVAPVRVWLDPADSKAATGRTIASYSWSFGDGTAGTTISPDVQERTYVTNLTSKTFSITLVVIDDKGAINSVTKTVKVENYQPVAGFEVSDEANVLADSQPGDGEWWTDKQDGLNDNRITYTNVPLGNRTVWVRSQQIVDGDWLLKDRDNPTPNGKSAEPAEYDDADGPNMCFDREAQTWEAAGQPTWFPNRAWGINTLKIDWGDYSSDSVDYVDFADAADTLKSHEYDFGAGGVQSWTITVTAIDYLGNEKSFSRLITMNHGG